MVSLLAGSTVQAGCEGDEVDADDADEACTDEDDENGTMDEDEDEVEARCEAFFRMEEDYDADSRDDTPPD